MPAYSAITVAQATPATAISRPITKTRSSKMFRPLTVSKSTSAARVDCMPMNQPTSTMLARAAGAPQMRMKK